MCLGAYNGRHIYTNLARELMNVMVKFGETFESMSHKQMMFAGIGANNMSADNIQPYNKAVSIQRRSRPTSTTGTGTDMTEGNHAMIIYFSYCNKSHYR